MVCKIAIGVIVITAASDAHVDLKHLLNLVSSFQLELILNLS